jgi:hypothetical protein
MTFWMKEPGPGAQPQRRMGQDVPGCGFAAPAIDGARLREQRPSDASCRGVRLILGPEICLRYPGAGRDHVRGYWCRPAGAFHNARGVPVPPDSSGGDWCRPQPMIKSRSAT